MGDELERRTEVLRQILMDDGIYPNNAALPLLVYRAAIDLSGADDPAAVIEALFRANGWDNSWRNGVYRFHHYHSTAHEVLGIYAGQARVQLGGEKGLVATVGRGDVVIIPAGVAHKNLGSSAHFRCVGSYPVAPDGVGQSPDLMEGRPGERTAADRRIAAVALPGGDPVYGARGPLVEHWLRRS